MISENLTIAEECQKISVGQLNLTDVLYIELGSQQIMLTSTRCNYGSHRQWFLCPACGSRIGTLYRKPLASDFFCRQCNKLIYQLQRYHRSNVEHLLRAINIAKMNNQKRN